MREQKGLFLDFADKGDRRGRDQVLQVHEVQQHLERIQVKKRIFGFSDNLIVYIKIQSYLKNE